MCYEKRPKYLGAFTPAYKTYIMYFIKLLKLLLLSSPCHRESSTDKKVSEKQSLSGATDATRSNGDPARTEVTSPGFWHLSARGMPGWAAGPLPTPLTHTWVSTTWGSPGTHSCCMTNPSGYHKKHHKSSPFCSQEPEGRTERGEGRCHKERSPQIHVGRAGTRQVPDAPSARCSAPPAAPPGF